MPAPNPIVIVVGSLAVTSGLVAWEMHTSSLQSRWFSGYARKLTWQVQDGPCDAAMPALNGPYDDRLGYRHLQDVQAKLTARDFRVSRQACPTPELVKLVNRGIAPPYDEKPSGMLQILDRDGNDLYRATVDQFAFGDFADLPALLVQSLLFVENRNLLGSERASQNPAVEWDRLFFAGTHYAVDKVIDRGNVQGGSTLATQIEKFRHSPEGRTAGGIDKLRQIFSASLRAYRDGTDTRATRREIILDYVNSMPLGAAMGEGEVTGLGQGMWAWFNKRPADVIRDLTLTEEDRNLQKKAETFKQTLALIMATRRPTLYLAKNHQILEERITAYLPLLVAEGIVSDRLARATRVAPLKFRDQVPKRVKTTFVDRKATNSVRAELLDLLDVENFYTLDRYDLKVETSIDSKVQERVTAKLRELETADYLARHGFYGEHLLGPGQDPSKVIYSFALYEASPEGNRLRVSADNLDKPLDINRNVKLELGSTAKLRTMANYLMVIASLYQRFHEAPSEALYSAEVAALDPISRWSAGWVRMHPQATLEEALEASLQRTFSCDPGEGFFTGRGLHYFSNFDSEYTGPATLRNAFQHSINLVYIRLMRELVQYYQAELDYDQKAILADSEHPQRRELLDAAMDNEARETLLKFYRRYSNVPYEAALARMCGKDARGLRRLAIFAMAEFPDASVADLRALAHRVYPETNAVSDTLMSSYHRAYAHKIRNSQDEAYLLGRHPLEAWMVRDRREHPETKWADVLERSAKARQATGEWIYPKRFKEAQNLRIRIELERRAFVEIHKAWQQLGYPFDSLVASLATAIGSSADRPQALAELVGIIQRGGVRVPLLRVESLHFAAGTPYETHFEPAQGPGDRVMPREVAAALKGLMQDVVQGGTARRVAASLTDAEGQPIPIGGKTGSGDNRFEKVAANGAVISSRAINRTASFVFVIGDRFFGMVSAYVEGEEAGKFSFTSSLALQAFRSIAPSVEPLVRKGELAARAAAPQRSNPALAARSTASAVVAARPARQVPRAVATAGTATVSAVDAPASAAVAPVTVAVAPAPAAVAPATVDVAPAPAASATAAAAVVYRP